MKGIILAGGSGTRLYPVTKAISKQLLPIYDKPMIYYPLSVLMLAGINDILIITTLKDKSNYEDLLGNGKKWGMCIEYSIQEKPEGLAQAFIIGEEYIGSDSVCLILGDNIFFGQGFTPILKKATMLRNGCHLFAYKVSDPERFGVVEFDEDYNAVSLEEKPIKPKSNWAVTGLYFYDNNVVEYAKSLKPSKRNELEITDLNQIYLKKNKVKVVLLGRGFAWLDTGTHDNLILAGQFVQTIEKRQGFKIACLEEIAFINGWIDRNVLKSIADELGKTEYSEYLRGLK